MRRQWADLQFVPTYCDGKVSALLFKKQLSSIGSHNWTDVASSRFNITLSDIFTPPADNPNPDLETLCSIVKDRIRAFRQRGLHLSSCLNSVFQICCCITDQCLCCFVCCLFVFSFFLTLKHSVCLCSLVSICIVILRSSAEW
jgi:hypothetical protein